MGVARCVATQAPGLSFAIVATAFLRKPGVSTRANRRFGQCGRGALPKKEEKFPNESGGVYV
jgi:hypothetical protein